MDEGDPATMAALNSLNEGVYNSLAAERFANNIIIQVLVAVLERHLGSEVRPMLAQGLRDSWEASCRALGDDHPIADDTREILQDFINSLEGK
jgi:hypothetical protein